VAFAVAQKTLERLEWSQVVSRLRAACRTPQAAARLAPEAHDDEPDGAATDAADDLRSDEEEGPDPGEPPPPRPLFAETLAEARERLALTREARELLDDGLVPPLAGAHDLEPALRRAGKGGVLEGATLLAAASSLTAVEAVRRFLAERSERAPGLAALADALEERRDLRRDIEESLERDGEVSDRASPALREARREVQGLGAEISARMQRSLQQSEVADALSDSFVTVRGGRYVLPVRSDMRGRVRGIVHDASRSGTTLFVEPQWAVELNNRLRQAELSVARETSRVLQQLSAALAAEADAVRAALAGLAELDLAFARGHLAREMDASEPALEHDGVFRLPQLRHPLLPPDEAVANDLHLGESFRVMVISGPNGGGKTVAMKAVGLAALLARAGLFVPAGPGARVAWVDAVLADIGDDQDIRQSLSTFSAHMASVSRIARDAGPHDLVLLDELGVGTDPAEGAALAQAVLEHLAGREARVIVTTHYNLLKEMAAVDPRFANASFEFDPDTLAPTYRLRPDVPGVSSAAAVAARMGMPGAVLGRADALLEREDRQVDRLLSELAAHRLSLEREQREARRLREEGEAARDAYRAKLEQLQERRDRLWRDMRRDLDRAFREAHAEVAGVIRTLQRGGSARDAERARARLEAAAARTREAEREAGVAPEPERERPAAPVDWNRARPGDPVRIAGGGTGLLESLPDRRGRVQVRVGAARMVVDAERVGAAPRDGDARKRPAPAVHVERAGPVPEPVAAGLTAGGTLPCDLRGERVRPALERLDALLDRAARDGVEHVRIIHGVGSGALRRAVREQLAASPYVADVRDAGEGEGGEGVTFAVLKG